MKTRLRKIRGTVERIPRGQNLDQVDLDLKPGEYVVAFEAHGIVGSYERKTEDWSWTAWIAQPLPGQEPAGA